MQKENKAPSDTHQYVGPYRLEKTLGKGQTGEFSMHLINNPSCLLTHSIIKYFSMGVL